MLISFDLMLYSKALYFLTPYDRYIFRDIVLDTFLQSKMTAGLNHKYVFIISQCFFCGMLKDVDGYNFVYYH